MKEDPGPGGINPYPDNEEKAPRNTQRSKAIAIETESDTAVTDSTNATLV